MPSQAFSTILKNAAEFLPYGDDVEEYDCVEDIESDCDDDFCDKEGYSVYDWIESGEVGWDESLQTYFLRAIELDGEPVWWALAKYLGSLPEGRVVVHSLPYELGIFARKNFLVGDVSEFLKINFKQPVQLLGICGLSIHCMSPRERMTSSFRSSRLRGVVDVGIEASCVDRCVAS